MTQIPTSIARVSNGFRIPGIQWVLAFSEQRPIFVYNPVARVCRVAEWALAESQT
jgi:hypothetical protein